MAIIADIYTDLVNAVKTVTDSKYIFIDNRPNIGNDEAPMSKFIVVSLPSGMSDIAIGRSQLMLRTRGVMYLFVKSKSNNTLNLNAMSNFVDSIVNLFPISGTKCVAVNPVPIMQGSDRNGYHITEIYFEIHTH